MCVQTNNQFNNLFKFNFFLSRLTITEFDAASMNLKINIPTTPGPLYDKEHVYKFTETPTPTPSEKGERSSKMFFTKNSPSPEVAKQIWPPPAKMRPASSMLDISNGEPTQISNKFSQSTFFINQDCSNDSASEELKTKRKKWYKIFLPPKDVKASKIKVIDEEPEIKEPKDKRPWYKLKKKKDKSKDKIAIAC